jgi:hypothetical protein
MTIGFQKKGLLALGAVIPGLEWKTIQNEIMSLRGVIGFDQLQAMREVFSDRWRSWSGIDL